MAHEMRHPEPRTMSRTFATVIRLLDDHDVPFLITGSIASDVYSRDGAWPREGSDIDLFLSEDDANRAHKVLSENGFHIEDPVDDWLLKAYRDGVLVDLIFRAAGTVVLDDEMLARARRGHVEGREVKILSPEDYVVVQSRTFSRETPEHLWRALDVLRMTTVDWEYLLKRAEDRPDLALALLVFARSNGITVPVDILRRLSGPAFGAG